MRWILAALLCILPLIAVAADSEPSLEPQLSQSHTVFESAEAAPLSHPWAGIYRTFAGGSTYSLAADGRYARNFSSCFGPFEVELGRIDVQGSSITLVPQEIKSVSPNHTPAAEKATFHVIRWADQRFLVDENSGRKFVDWINSFGAPEIGRKDAGLPLAGLRRDTPEAKLPDRIDTLELPPELRKLLRPVPASAHLVALLESPANLKWERRSALWHHHLVRHSCRNVHHVAGLQLLGCSPFHRGPQGLSGRRCPGFNHFASGDHRGMAIENIKHVGKILVYLGVPAAIAKREHRVVMRIFFERLAGRAFFCG